MASDWRVPCLNRCLTNLYTGAGHVRFSCLLKSFRPPRDLNVRVNMTFDDVRFYKLISIIMLIIFTALSMTFIFYIKHFGSQSMWPLLFLIPALLPWLLVMTLLWKCPKCGKQLGKEFVKNCTNCGYEPTPNDKI